MPIYQGVEDAQGSQGGTTYVVSGGAGAPLYEELRRPDWFGEVANPVEHYIIADVTPGEISFVVRTLDDVVLDEFTIAR